YHAQLVRGREGGGHLGTDPHHLLPRQRPTRQPLCQGLPLDQLHHQVSGGLTGGQRHLAVVVDLGHARVVDAGGGAHLPPRRRPHRRIGEQRREQYLDRHVPAEQLVGCPPHLRHAAGTDPLHQREPVRETL